MMAYGRRSLQQNINEKPIIDWIKMREIGKRKGSYIWSNFQKIKNWFMEWIKWSFRRGNMLITGQDNIVSVSDKTQLSEGTIMALHQRGIILLG